MTYSTICDPEKSEEHILVSSWCDFRHHGLRICVIRSLKEPEEDIIDPKVAHMMVSHFLGP